MSQARRKFLICAWKMNGGLGGTRTRDQRLKRPLLYRLSYQPVVEDLAANPKGRRKLTDDLWRRKGFRGSQNLA